MRNQTAVSIMKGPTITLIVLRPPLAYLLVAGYGTAVHDNWGFCRVLPDKEAADEGKSEREEEKRLPQSACRAQHS